MNFKIVLSLNHFFHDHRSVCRIFVSNKMQTIKDLQDHISKIFNIKNFVLMAQNQYLPSVESVMVLNKDDIITAVPLHTSSAMCTSTPFTNTQATLDVTENYNRMQDSSSDSEVEPPKKRKISSGTFKRPTALNDSFKNATSSVNIHEATLYDEDTYVTSCKKKRLKKYNLLNQDLEEPTSSRKPTEVTLKNSSSKQKVSRNKNYESVREKVMYFENQVNVDVDKDVLGLQPSKTSSLVKSDGSNSLEKSNENNSLKKNNETNSFEKSNENNCLEKSNENNSSGKNNENNSLEKNYEGNYLEKSNENKSVEKSNEDSLSSPNEFDISDMMRRHKLFVKSNTSNVKMSIELPKQHNIVKSIIVNNISQNSSGFKSIETSLHSKMDGLSNTSKSSRESSFTSEKQLKILQNVILQKRMTMEPQENNTKDKNVILKEDTNNEEIVLENEGKTEKNTQDNHETINEIEMTELEIETANISMEPDPVLSNGVTTCSTTTEDQFGKHVTKRKRVRKHKNRKSKEVPIETKPIKPNYDVKLTLAKPAPLLHIRFDDYEGVAVKTTDDLAPKENILCENFENQVQIGGEGDAEMENQIDIIEDEEKPSDAILEEDPDIEQSELRKDKLKISTLDKGSFFNYVSKTINNCPLMLTAPKAGNTVAFKILKITENYTPGMSNYIIGKVLNVSEDGNTIKMYILDGLDETRNPIGKFSLDSEEEDDIISVYQNYEWHTLMEQRLVSM